MEFSMEVHLLHGSRWNQKYKFWAYILSKEAAIDNWNITINKIRQQLWMHMSRFLNIIQKTIMCNTFVLTKLWFMSAIFPTNNQMTTRITNVVGMFIWNGHPLYELGSKGGKNL
jgi:hypothetical protein